MAVTAAVRPRRPRPGQAVLPSAAHGPAVYPRRVTAADELPLETTPHAPAASGLRERLRALRDPERLRARVPERLRARVVEMARFLVVGGVAFVVDMGLFNLLMFGPGRVLEHKSTTANVISIAVATLVSWVGNRHWTFAAGRTDRQVRELLVYGAINALAALVPVATVALWRYGLHYDSQLALNAAKVTGIVLGTILRYVGYKLWVFTGPSGTPATARI